MDKVVHFELPFDDGERATTFYREAFGWQLNAMPSFQYVLATTTQAARPGDPWNRPVTSPAIWTRSWGQGRIFVATPGHSLDVLDHPSVRTVVERGLLWAARTPDGPTG